MAGEEPYLPFFRNRPPDLPENPPLCSSLQSLETAFFLIGLGRYPSALVILGQAIEGAIKAGLQIPADIKRKPNFYDLTTQAEQKISVPAAIAGSLNQFRDARNDFSHYGFSPKDDHRSADEMLRTGLPYLEILYTEFFGFDLQESLLWEIGIQYGISKSVFADANLSGSANECAALRVLGHQIRHTFHPSFISQVEYEILVEARSTFLVHDFMDEKRNEIETAFYPHWFFDCPICGEIRSLGTQLDDAALDNKTISLIRVHCLSCGLNIPPDVPLLADRVCAKEIESETAKIFAELGIS